MVLPFGGQEGEGKEKGEGARQGPTETKMLQFSIGRPQKKRGRTSSKLLEKKSKEKNDGGKKQRKGEKLNVKSGGVNDRENKRRSFYCDEGQMPSPWGGAMSFRLKWQGGRHSSGSAGIYLTSTEKKNVGPS